MTGLGKKKEKVLNSRYVLYPKQRKKEKICSIVHHHCVEIMNCPLSDPLSYVHL